MVFDVRGGGEDVEHVKHAPKGVLDVRGGEEQAEHQERAHKGAFLVFNVRKG